MAFNRKPGCVYMLTTAGNTALYIGVTAQLRARIWQHRNHYYGRSFTSRYHCTKLVGYRWLDGMEAAIREEKRLKSGSRSAKEALIRSVNPAWEDL